MRRMRTMLGVVGMAGLMGIAIGAGKTHPFVPPPTMTMGKFAPDPVDVGSETVAKLVGKATPPTKVEGESQATLTWTWKVDKVEFREHDENFVTAAAGSYDVAITGGGGADPHALLTLKPKRVGEWQVTVHGTATFMDTSGDTWVGETEKHADRVASEKGAGTQPG